MLMVRMAAIARKLFVKDGYIAGLTGEICSFEWVEFADGRVRLEELYLISVSKNCGLFARVLEGRPATTMIIKTNRRPQ